MNEFSKISIHCHFGGEQADYTIDRSHKFKGFFNLSTAFSQINEAAKCGFQLLGQTNHNYFDASAFCLMKRYCLLKKITLIPGVEVDLQNWKHPANTVHLVLLVDPLTNPFVFQQKLRSLYQDNISLDSDKKPRGADCFFLTIQQLSEIAILSRSIICIHGIKQRSKSMAKNPEMAADIMALSRFLPVATEDNKDFHKLKIEHILKNFLSEEYCEWLSGAANISSADQTRFSEIKSPTYLWAGNSFDDLFYSVLVGEKRVLREEDIINQTSFVSRIKIDENLAMGSSDIICSHGINAIIGSSGSGKTLLLDLLKRKLSGQPLTENTSNLSDYKDLCNLENIHLYDLAGVELTQESSYKVVELENLYQKIIKAYSSEDSSILDDLGLSINDGEFNRKLGQFGEKLNSLLINRRKIKELQATINTKLALVVDALNFIAINANGREDVIEYRKNPRVSNSIKKLTEDCKDLKKDINQANESFKKLQEIAKNRKLTDRVVKSISNLKQKFIAELDSLMNDQLTKKEKLMLKEKANNLIYDATQEYNNIISRQSAQVNEKNQTVTNSLQVIAQSCLDLKKCQLSEQIPSLDKNEIKQSLELHSSSESAKLEISDINLELRDTDAIKEAFPGAIGNKPKINKSKFKPPYNLSSKDDVNSLMNVFFEADFGESLTLKLSYKDILDYEVKIKTNEDIFVPIEDLSAGMLSKAYVSNFLDHVIEESGSNTVIIFDQPESNMEKSFLRTVLADKFNNLRQTHQLFIATHEPLLVVNADSNEIILASNEKKVRKNNHITYSNRSFVGARGKSELVEKIADLIDGGSQAVRQRNDIYEGMKT